MPDQKPGDKSPEKPSIPLPQRVTTAPPPTQSAKILRTRETPATECT